MAVSAYEVISTQTLASAAATVTLSSIPSTYTDLVLVINGTAVSGGGAFRAQVNADTATNYSGTNISGDGTTASSSRFSSINYIRGGEFGSANTTIVLQFQNYSNTTTYKTVLARYATPAISSDAWVNLWRSTSAISSIVVFINAINISAGSTFTLYGIKAAA
jgi:hypothetical protein